MELNLKRLILEELTTAQGVGEIELIIPNMIFKAEIDQAVGQIIMDIPKESPVRLKIINGITSFSLPSNFDKHNEYYYSPEAHEGVEFIKLEINQALGNIIVRSK